jgi:hypothetical protein
MFAKNYQHQLIKADHISLHGLSVYRNTNVNLAHESISTMSALLYAHEPTEAHSHRRLTVERKQLQGAYYMKQN